MSALGWAPTLGIKSPLTAISREKLPAGMISRNAIDPAGIIHEAA